MDNQHVTLDSTELAWLACAVECDGSISIGYHNRAKLGIKPQCQITFCNTGKVMFDRFLNGVNALGINGYVRPLKQRAGREHCKIVHQIELMNQSKCKRFLEAVYPYLLYKKPQADLMLEFINSRMFRGARQGKPIPFSKRELQIVYQMRALNHKGTSQTEDQDLVQAIRLAA